MSIHARAFGDTLRPAGRAQTSLCTSESGGATVSDGELDQAEAVMSVVRQ
jgi:hypothetical protein